MVGVHAEGLRIPVPVMALGAGTMVPTIPGEQVIGFAVMQGMAREARRTRPPLKHGDCSRPLYSRPLTRPCHHSRSSRRAGWDSSQGIPGRPGMEFARAGWIA